jgi:hypothetical protein
MEFSSSSMLLLLLGLGILQPEVLEDTMMTYKSVGSVQFH